MGSVKEELKSSDKKLKTVDAKDGVAAKAGGVFGRFTKRKAARDTPEVQASTFADLIEEAETRLQALITTKETELSNESGREEYNRRALSRLKTMQFHLDQIMDTAADYGDDH